LGRDVGAGQGKKRRSRGCPQLAEAFFDNGAGVSEAVFNFG
jgi:hypothetical protein